LGQIASALREELTRNQTAGRSAERIVAELDEVQEFERQVARLLTGDAIRAGAGAVPGDFASLTLMRLPGYREAYESLMTLRFGLSLEGDVVQLSIKELDRLYETWCFIQVVRTVMRQCPQVKHSEGLFSISRRGIRVTLERGTRSAIRLRTADRAVCVTYNPSYPGLTGAQRPDIVLEISIDGWPFMFIVLDAKYRLETSDEYVRTFGGVGPPIDAINTLHRYRDAITLMIEEQGLGRPVVKGVALFPLSKSNSEQYTKHQLFQSLEIMGIGGLPFLPGATNLVEEWLFSQLGLPPEQLAQPGPPLLALSEKLKRSFGS
jgi:hypothetical protein